MRDGHLFSSLPWVRGGLKNLQLIWGDGLIWDGLPCCWCPWPHFYKTRFAIGATSGGHQHDSFMANILQQLSKWSGLPCCPLSKVPASEGCSFGFSSVLVDVGENMSGLCGCSCQRHSLTRNYVFEYWRFYIPTAQTVLCCKGKGALGLTWTSGFKWKARFLRIF